MTEVERLRAKLRKMAEALAALKAKAFGDKPAKEDTDALEAALTEIEETEKQLAQAERVEALEAKHSKPAGAPVSGNKENGTEEGTNGGTTFARPKEDWGVEKRLALASAAVVKAGKDGDPEKVLVEEGYQGFVDHLKGLQSQSKTANAKLKAVNTIVSSEGGILVPTPMNGGLIPLLRDESTFLAAGPTRVELVNGQFNQPAQATGATAAYVGEGGRKPVSTPTFDAIAMKARKVAGIVPMTLEARKWSVGNLADFLENDLRSAIGLAMETAAYLGTGVGANPLGILRKSGILTITPTFADPLNPTIAEIDRLASLFMLAFRTRFLGNKNKWRWVMNARTIMRIADMRVGGNQGEFAYPTMQGMNPVFKTIPVIDLGVLPANTGTGLDETTISLVNFADVLYGEEQDIIVKYSDQATLDVTGDGTDLLHLFQDNMFAILAEAEHDFGLRRKISVAKASGIRF